jgi:hypothetical protein
MSRSSAPSTNANKSSDDLVNTNAYLPFKTLAIQRLSKILIDGAMTPKRFRLEALHYLIYPKTLSHYRIHQLGWLATQSQAQIYKLDKAETLAPLVERINALEADEKIPPYERVAKIVSAIKEATGKQFIRNGAFRELMTAKFNEYTLTERLDEIGSIDDALRILKEGAVQSKPMKVISTFPELFASTSIRNMLGNDADANFVFGGATDSTLPASITAFIRALTPERVASGAARQLLEDLVLANVDPASATHARLTEFAATLPKAPSGEEVGNMVAFLKFAFSNKISATDMFQKPSFVAAAETMLSDDADPDVELRRWISLHLDDAYGVDAQSTGRVIEDGKPLVKIVQKLMAAIKDAPVQHANSYDSVLINLSDTYAGDRQMRRHAFVWALDSILGVNPALPRNQFHRECAKILHGVPLSLFPKDTTLVPAAKSLRDKVSEAVSTRFNEQKHDEATGRKLLGPVTDTYIGGAPSIGDFRNYAKSAKKPELTVRFEGDEDEAPVYKKPAPLYMRTMPAPAALTYNVRRAREVMFGADPRNPPEDVLRPSLTIHAHHGKGPDGRSNKWISDQNKVNLENATSLLGPAMNIATRDTALHRLLERASAAEGQRLERTQFAQLVTSACRHGAVASAVDDIGNSLIHDVVANFGKLPTKDWENAIVTLTDHGAHFGGGNHFGVSLAEMLPNGISSNIEALALSTIAQHNVVSALTSPDREALSAADSDADQVSRPARGVDAMVL